MSQVQRKLTPFKPPTPRRIRTRVGHAWRSSLGRAGAAVILFCGKGIALTVER
jgi:hypothetical protein